MSLEANTQLLERASDMITYFEGKLPAQILEKDIEKRDFEALRYHVVSAEAVAAQEEMEAGDVF